MKTSAKNGNKSGPKGKGIFRILEFPNPSGQIAYRVTGWTMNGERIRQNFVSHAAAVARMQELEIQSANLEGAARPVVTRLTPEQASEAEAAFAQLGDRPLLPVVRFYLENYREPVTKITVATAFAQFIADKERQNCRPDSIISLKRKNALLLARYGQKIVGELLPEQVKEIVFRPGLSPVSQDNVRRAMGCFFNWATEHGFCKESPLAKIKAVKIERDEPQIMPLSDVRKLLAAAASYKEGVVLPFVAISLFAAVRPKELERLSWDDVDLDQRIITIQGKGAKMRERRMVELSDSLVAWLKPFAVARLPFIGPNWRRDFDTVKVRAGYGGRSGRPEGKDSPAVKPWVPDIMRHTAISMHLAMHQHEGKTATWAGNSPDIIQRHYRGLVSAADAKAFWNIRPDAQEPVKMPTQNTLNKAAVAVNA
ncbi:MAG: tyrosine-type recombinase/integrase [Chloroflexi bacterium]|nr:tyrosine-type recombinase/integrase [Chloroflexota bacterium]